MMPAWQSCRAGILIGLALRRVALPNRRSRSVKLEGGLLLSLLRRTGRPAGRVYCGAPRAVSAEDVMSSGRAMSA
ncbi:hypothetical protein D9M72_633100 [compost metagenome]